MSKSMLLKYAAIGLIGLSSTFAAYMRYREELSNERRVEEPRQHISKTDKIVLNGEWETPDQRTNYDFSDPLDLVRAYFALDIERDAELYTETQNLCFGLSCMRNLEALASAGMKRELGDLDDFKEAGKGLIQTENPREENYRKVIYEKYKKLFSERDEEFEKYRDLAIENGIKLKYSIGIEGSTKPMNRRILSDVKAYLMKLKRWGLYTGMIYPRRLKCVNGDGDFIRVEEADENTFYKTGVKKFRILEADRFFGECPIDGFARHMDNKQKTIANALDVTLPGQEECLTVKVECVNRSVESDYIEIVVERRKGRWYVVDAPVILNSRVLDPSEQAIQLQEILGYAENNEELSYLKYSIDTLPNGLFTIRRKTDKEASQQKDYWQKLQEKRKKFNGADAVLIEDK